MNSFGSVMRFRISEHLQNNLNEIVKHIFKEYLIFVLFFDGLPVLSSSHETVTIMNT